MAGDMSTHTDTATASLPVADPHPQDLEIKRICLLHRFQGQRVGRRTFRVGRTDYQDVILGPTL